MAQLFRLNEKWPYPLMPSEYVRRQFHVSFQDDPVAVACRHITGLSTIVWGNDYPHAEGTFRGSRQLIAEQFAGVPADERDAMVGGTLGGLLGFAPRRRLRGRHLSELRFDGRVADRHRVRGGGSGAPTRCCSAERGASVVVNDLGGSMEGTGADAGPASDVVGRDHRAAGGAARGRHQRRRNVDGRAGAGGRRGRATSGVSTSSSTTPASSAGPGSPRSTRTTWPGISPCTRSARSTSHVPAWPHMVGAGYGRIVMTTSSGVFGLKNNTSYATAKAAVIGLTRSLAVAAPKHGIRVNLIAPAAMTRMAGDGDAPRHGPRAGRADGGIPGPRVLSGQRRDVRRRGRPLRPHLPRDDAPGTCIPAPTSRSRTSPRTGRTSTTRRATRCRKTFRTGRRGSGAPAAGGHLAGGRPCDLLPSMAALKHLRHKS